MKNLILLVLLICFTSIKGQEQSATIHFRDGTSFDGYGYIDKKNNIKFRFEDQEEYDTWTDLMVAEIDFYHYNGVNTYRYVDLRNNSNYTLLKVLSDGHYKLYVKMKTSYNYEPKDIVRTIGGISTGARPTRVRTEGMYYLNKNNEKKFEHISKREMRRKIRTILTDCEDFTSRYDDGEFKENTLKEIVEYYNYWCVD